MRLILSTVLCAALAGPLAAKPPLSQVAEIDDALMMIAIADAIRKDCDDISARMLRAMTTINSLKNRARDLGYTDEEIENYVTSKSEKERMRAKASAYLKDRGVDAGRSKEMCAFGEQEIARSSQIGVLLR